MTQLARRAERRRRVSPVKHFCDETSTSGGHTGLRRLQKAAVQSYIVEAPHRLKPLLKMPVIFKQIAGCLGREKHSLLPASSLTPSCQHRLRPHLSDAGLHLTPLTHQPLKILCFLLIRISWDCLPSNRDCCFYSVSSLKPPSPESTPPLLLRGLGNAAPVLQIKWNLHN